MSITKDLNQAARGVLKNHWDKNTNLTALITKLTTGKGIRGGAYFTQAPLEREAAYGVKLTFREDPSITLELSLNAQEVYAFASTGKDKTLKYAGTAPTGNGAKNRVSEWLVKIGLSRDEDIDAKIQNGRYKEAAPAPVYRSSES